MEILDNSAKDIRFLFLVEWDFCVIISAKYFVFDVSIFDIDRGKE